ncbi:RNA ligase and tail fiber protein attachment catalyst [Acinetobacter phage ZZ1]|uniref:RNA ligase 1 n=1 Tax=Acinetobacter phage ZZ1 TaxID=1049283 RepID=I3WW23_9CAUD|nr:RNA ligase and tail fiber protein attachment catalyst [Acinetobacter phage ZZ1]AFL47693.1 RNA ligase 1 and tail fiber attachment catalyst [Acinetobacter phage ZZ1]
MQELYNNLMALIVPGNFTNFFYKDFTTIQGTKVRIFTYHYASYSDWLKPDALECRGIMFEMDDETPVRIMSRPMEKFFNLNENPFTTDLDLSTIEYGMDKVDGSLVSSYIDKGDLYLKSKASITSTQAIEATNLLWAIQYKHLRARVLELAEAGYTCNFEYVAPNNRIVIAYPERALILLNIRNNETGEYVPYREIQADAALRPFLVDAIIPQGDPDEVIEEIRSMQNTEGYVFVMKSGLQFKLKTAWYSNLHRVKDTLNNNEGLFQVVVEGGSDDIKSLFDDELSKAKIEKFENIFFTYLNTAITELTRFHDSHKGVERKDYAIDAQTYFKNLNMFELFGVSMLLYTGKISIEDMVKEINKVFLKNFGRFVPPEYRTNIVDE